MTRKKTLNIYITEEILGEFERIARAEHLDAGKFAALVISKFSDLKQGHGLSALTSIPKDHFKGRPGRVANDPSPTPA